MGVSNLRGAVVSLLLAITAFGGAYGARSGDMPKLPSFLHTSGGGQAKVLEAGNYEFSVPHNWTKVDAKDLQKVVGTGDGKIVGGICAEHPDGGCGKGTAMTYMLFSDGASMPAPGVLEERFDHSLPKQLSGFTKIGASIETTVDGTTFLRYEFTFKQNAKIRHEVIGAYRYGSHGLLAVAVGPQGDFAVRKDDVDTVLDGATTTS
jgi:hypothetical protein